MKRLFPTVRIHSWGGLGSQLFAIALAKDFQAIFPKRSIVIVLHTGGVTRRLPEVVELFPDFDYQYQEDFQLKNNGSQKISNQSKFDLRIHLKKVINLIGFLADCNDDSSTNRLFPWVLSIRGHYSYRSIHPNFLSQLAEHCQSIEGVITTNLSKTCVVHYRLGDLLLISEKDPISAISVASEYLRVQSQIHYASLIVF